MQAVIETYEDRVKELELYFSALEELSELENAHPNQLFLQSEFLKMLKSSALIMIYNLMESTIVNVFEEIYDSFDKQGITYNMACKEIQDVWFSFMFKQVYQQESHYNSYKKKAKEITISILSNEPLKLNRNAMSGYGNFDAEKIRKICHEHGIMLKNIDKIKGQYVLKEVKEQRNLLSHGGKSFTECGRDYTINDLKKKKDGVIEFLKEILVEIQEYKDNEVYLYRHKNE